MIVKLIELKNTNGSYKLNEVYLNPEHVVSIRPVSLSVNESKFPEGLDKNAQFSKIMVNYGNNGTSMVVTGSPEMVERKINDKRKLLKG
tara:strand:+ start:100 stop:366 length:267 start_codon:yes stop_codon:yes gene_type:complete